MDEKKFKFSVSELSPGGTDFQIEISSGAQRWLVQRSQPQCLDFLRQTRAEFGKPSGEVLSASLSAKSLQQALETVCPDDRDPLRVSALFSFLQDLDKTSWFMRAHVRSLEAKIEKLSTALESFESKFEKLDKMQSLLSSFDSESLSLSLTRTNTSSLSHTPLCLTARGKEKEKERENTKESDFSFDDDLHEKSLSKENTAENTFSLFTSASETSCFDDSTLCLDKKKWEEVSLSREASAAGNHNSTAANNASSLAPSAAEDALLDDSALLNSFFAADYLLSTNSESCPLDNIPEPALQTVFRGIDALLKAIQPHESQLQYRTAATAFVRKQVRLSLGALAFESGLHAIHCFLPTDALKLTLPLTQQQLGFWHGSLAERLKHIADRTTPAATPRSLELFLGGAGEGENEELSEQFANNLRSVQVLANEQSVVVHAASASTSSTSSSSSAATAANNHANASSAAAQSSNTQAVVHFQLDGVDCQVSANQRLELCNLAFLEEFATMVGRDRLFKRSLLLVRSWWEYESSSYAGVMMKPSLSEQTIAFMLVSVFNNYHHCIAHPLEAFVLFLREFSAFDGLSQAITVQGLVPFHSPAHSSSAALFTEREREGESNVPCLVKPQPHQLISQEILEKYWQMFFVHEAASALSPSASSSSAAVSSLTNQLRLREAMLTNMQRSLARFERNAFSVVHPFLFCNLVVDRPSPKSSSESTGSSATANSPGQQSRRLSLLPRVLQASYAAISSLLDQCKVQYALHVNNPSALENAVLELLQRFLPSVYPRLSSPFRPDALNNSIFLGSDCNTDADGNDNKSEGEKESALSEREFTDETRSAELLDIAGERLWESVAYCNFIAENVLTESAILSFCADTLAVKGPLPAGELGKLLSEASSIQSLSHKLREKFGGLKKFLERFPDKFIFSNDHPFNPHVLLRSAISKENLELIDRGIFPIHLISKSARAAAAQAAKKNNNNNNNGQGGKSAKDGSSSKATNAHANNNINRNTNTAANNANTTSVNVSAGSAPSSPAAPYAAISASLVLPSTAGTSNITNNMNIAGLNTVSNNNSNVGNAADFGAMNNPFFAQHNKSLSAVSVSVPGAGGRDTRVNNFFAAAAPQTHSHHSHNHGHHLVTHNAHPHAQNHSSHMRAFSAHSQGPTAYPQDLFAPSALYNNNNTRERDRERERDPRAHGNVSFFSNSFSSHNAQSFSQHAHNNTHSHSAAHASASRLRSEFFTHANSHANSSRGGHGNARYSNDSHSRGGGGGGHLFAGNSHTYGSSSVSGNADLLNFPGVGVAGGNGVFNTEDDFGGYSFHSLGRDAASGNGSAGVFSSKNTSGNPVNNNSNNNSNNNTGGSINNSVNTNNNGSMSSGEDFFLERESSGGFRGNGVGATSSERAFSLGEDGALFLGDFSHNNGNNFRFPPF